MAGIKALPLEVVHLIAAGEVIDSLAAVVRELAENALDAGATRISISLYPDQWRIRVADNGLGMNLDDLKQAAAPHSTSKIGGSSDLWRISSLGFRGEALHSLAQLASLEILSRSAESDEGWWVAFNTHGQPIQVEPAAIAPGTVVIVSDLFANWSARRDGLPTLAQQLKAIQATVHQLALCHPNVTWQVDQNDREWFNLWTGKTARQILPQILRDVRAGDLQELMVEVGQVEEGSGVRGQESDNSKFRIQNSEFEIQIHSALRTPHSPLVNSKLASPSLYLLLGLPDRCHRRRPDWIRVALNGRFVHMPELEQTILSGFRRTLPRDRFPVCFVHLQVSPDQVDWNRHPAKSEVYLHHLNIWKEEILRTINQTLSLSSVNLSDTLYSDRVGNLLKVAESEAGYGSQRLTVSSQWSNEEDSASDSSPIPHPHPFSAPLPNFTTPIFLLNIHPACG